MCSTNMHAPVVIICIPCGHGVKKQNILENSKQIKVFLVNNLTNWLSANKGEMKLIVLTPNMASDNHDFLSIIMPLTSSLKRSDITTK